MEFDRLEEFAVIAEEKSIAGAARSMGISPATLSARLSRFEEQMGSPLFFRVPGGVELTAAGEQLLPSALDILDHLRRIRREMDAAREHAYHRLRIAVSGSNLPLYLGPFLDQLNRTYPDLELDILDDSRFGIVDGISSGQVDLYFAPVMEDFAPRQLSKNPVAPASQYVILPRSHPLAEQSMVSIRELSGERFLLYPRTAESAIRDFQLRNLRDSGIRFSLYESETSTLFLKLLVPVGKGILLRPSPMMDMPPNAVSIPVTDLPWPATTCFFYDRHTASPDVLAFVRDFSAFPKEGLNHEHHPSL